jgi:DNA-binding transcriptional LysR family regulator
MMDLWQLHILCKVIEKKSFSRAAEAIRLSQPTVSSHIKELETHYGCQLVDRMARKVVPTKAGELLYGYAKRLISLRDEAETAMAEHQGTLKGSLTVGGSTIPGNYILPRMIAHFAENAPEVTISLIIADTEQIVNETISGRLEFGIVGAKSNTKGITQEQLIQDEMCLVIPMGHKWAEKKGVSIKQLLEEPFIVRESGSGTRISIEQRLSRRGYRLEDFKIVAEMGSTQAIIQGIKNNMGVSIISRIAVTDDVKADLLKTLNIEDVDLKRNFYLTRHKSRSLSPIGKTFISFLKDMFSR